MELDSSFTIKWYARKDLAEICDMDEMEAMWRRENRLARENWTGLKAYVDVGKPPRDFEDEKKRTMQEEIMGYKISPAIWEKMKLLKAERELEMRAKSVSHEDMRFDGGFNEDDMDAEFLTAGTWSDVSLIGSFTDN